MRDKFAVFFYLLVFLYQPVFCQVQGNLSRPKIYAVIVGISDYKDPDIPDLKYAEKDALAFYDFLRSKNVGSVPEENIALLTGTKATRSNILAQVIDKFTRSNKEDLVIFYFSGHGRAGELENMGYLLNYDTENDNAAGSSVSMDDVKTRIDKCQAKMKLSYIDACHAGLFKSMSKGSMVEENKIIISSYLEGVARANAGNISFLASYATQQSVEDDKLGHGVFTYYLLKGLRGAADIEEDGAEGYNNGIITSGELASYLTHNIQLATKFKQRPTIEGDKDGLFPLSVLRDDISIFNEIHAAKVIGIVPPFVPPGPVKCNNCNGEGTITVKEACPDCGGKGSVRCSECRGTGNANTIILQDCPKCSGKGYKMCNICKGKKIITANEICPVCHGRGINTNTTPEKEKAINNVTEENARSKDKKGCESKNTGDYCFENKTNKVMYVCLFILGKWWKEVAVEIGQTQCFYDRDAAAYDYVIGSKRYTWYKSDAERSGEILVEACKSKIFVIK